MQENPVLDTLVQIFPALVTSLGSSKSKYSVKQ